jgi:hypothetical protein
VAAKPSGSGELVLSSLSVDNSVVSFWCSSGMAGRDYILSVLATCRSGARYQILITLPMGRTLRPKPLPPPPCPDFGPPIDWDAVIYPIGEFYPAKYNSSVFYFKGQLTGAAFVPFPRQPVVPSEDYTTERNSSVFYFKGLLTDAPFTPFEFPQVIVPSLDFRSARNAALRIFRGQPTGGFYKPGLPPAGPGQDFTDPKNSSVFYFKGRLTGTPFTPLAATKPALRRPVHGRRRRL